MSTAAVLQPPTIDDQRPTTRGWISTTYRHYKGKRLGPYYFRKWKVGKKIHRQYVKPEDVERIRAECQAHREKQQTKREGTKQINRLLDNWDFLGRMYFQSECGKEARPDQAAYVVRLHTEGMYIIGRPRYRLRKAFGVPLSANLATKFASFKAELLQKITQAFGDPQITNSVNDRAQVNHERGAMGQEDSGPIVFGAPLEADPS